MNVIEMKLTNKQLKSFSDKLSKHLSECKENWISENEFIVYKDGDNFIDIVDGHYRLVTTYRLIYYTETSYCTLYIDDFDVLYKHKNKLNQLDVYIENRTIKVKPIGQVILDNL